MKIYEFDYETYRSDSLEDILKEIQKFLVEESWIQGWRSGWQVKLSTKMIDIEKILDTPVYKMLINCEVHGEFEN